MIVLITGGFGFIGGRLGQQFARGGHRVLLGSRLNRRAPDWLPASEVRQTRWDDLAALTTACAGAHVIVHAAGMNAQESTATPAAAFETNAIATMRLADAAIAAGVRRFVYLSTAHVYGNPLRGAITEDNCTTNVHPYAASHRAGEDAVRYASSRSALDAVIVRLSNAFGAPTHVDAPCWTLLVNDLCRQAIVSGELALQSAGGAERDFVPMSDVCRAIEFLSCAERDETAQIFNIGSGATQSVLAMAELVRNRVQLLSGLDIPIRRPAALPSDIRITHDFQIDRLRARGFEPQLDLDGEVDELLRFCQSEEFALRRIVA